MRYRALGRTGLQISELGFGASPLGAVYGAFAQQDGVAERADIDAVMSYCQYTLQDRRLAAWRERFAERGVGILNASLLAMGALTSRGAPPWHPASTAVLERCADAAAPCQARGADLAKLALQYSVSGTGLASTVVGSADPENVHRNVRWIGEPIDQALLADVESCLAPVRDQGWINGRTENQQPGGEP